MCNKGGWKNVAAGGSSQNFLVNHLRLASEIIFSYIHWLFIEIIFFLKSILIFFVFTVKCSSSSLSYCYYRQFLLPILLRRMVEVVVEVEVDTIQIHTRPSILVAAAAVAVAAEVVTATSTTTTTMGVKIVNKFWIKFWLKWLNFYKYVIFFKFLIKFRLKFLLKILYLFI